jgi:hypothetical protein
MVQVKQQWSAQIRQNTLRLAKWTISWVASMALATFGPIYLWDGNATLSLAAILLNALLGCGVIWANIRYLKGLDELQQKLNLEAMALALGVGVVGGLSYSLLDTTNVITGDAEISVLVIVISLTYLISLIIGQVRYR